ncbi:MAG: hypothetical protein A2Y22_03130 [Clostridiales bacterium GWD2_32_59]|nr:MAG: hypothetical protein A2Y22_03130 [Clostridiales bacterium GWD2_32_59]
MRDKVFIKELCTECKEEIQKLMSSIENFVFIFGEDGRIKYANKYALDKLEYTEESIKLISVFDIRVPEDKETTEGYIAQILEVKKGSSNLRFYSKSKKIFQVETNVIKGVWNGQYVFYCISQDVTDKKNIQRSLGVKEKLLSAMVEVANELLRERDIMKAIERSLEIMGKTLNTSRAHLFKSYYDENQNGYISQRLEWVSEDGKPIEDSSYLRNIPFEMVGKSIDLLNNGIMVEGLVKDLKESRIKDVLKERKIRSLLVMPIIICTKFWGCITFAECKEERVWLEDEKSIIRAFEGYIVATIKRNDMENELKMARDLADAANIAKSAFIANVSHEIRTPMNGIMGFLELLKNTNLSVDQEEYVKQASSASKVLLYLINNILDLSKIEAGKLEIEKREFELDEVINCSVSTVRVKAAEKCINLKIKVDSRVPIKVIGDSYRLQQILNNLLSNAVKFTSNGEISLLVELLSKNEENIYIIFEVKDTGIGIEKENLNLIFEPFIQVDISSTRKYEGTGLGLKITRDLIHMMDGDITVESEVGKGTKFSFTVKLGLEYKD